MRKARKFIIGFVALCLVAALLCGCTSKKEARQMVFDDSMTAFSQAISAEDLEGMTLKIYAKYLNGFVCTVIPETIDDLIHRTEKSSPDDILTMDTDTLKENRELLKQLSEESFVFAEEEVRMDISWCFVFKTKNQEKVLEIAIGGYSQKELDRQSKTDDGQYEAPTMKYIYVNDFAVEWNETATALLDTLFEQARGNRFEGIAENSKQR